MISSLYIHIPFCDHICSYCDFAKVESKYFDRKKYLDKLFDEFNSYAILDNSLKTIYIGGGTPSALNEEELEYLLSFFYSHFKNVEEFTFEANPESLTLNKIKILSKYHVNRVSLGVETTDVEGIKLLNRKHTIIDVIEAIKNLKDNNITNINLDFIFGYHNQTIYSLNKDIDFALSLDVTHLSFYSLIIEDNTILKIKGYQEEDENLLSDMYSLINRRLNNSYFKHYEVSNYAKEGYKSIHNLTYWLDKNYYAIGLGASSYINDKRIKNTMSINNYLNGIIKRDIDIIDFVSLKEEYIMLHFRLLDGIKYKEYQNIFKSDFKTEHHKAILKNKDLLNINDDSISIKEDYFFIMDQIVIDFI